MVKYCYVLFLVDEAERVKRKRDEVSEWEDDSEEVAERDEVQCYIVGQFFWDAVNRLSCACLSLSLFSFFLLILDLESLKKFSSYIAVNC